MRATFLLIASLVLFAGGCSSNKGPVPPPPLPNKEWLTGKWKNDADVQFLAGFEFDKDGVVKLTFRGMKDTIPCHYTWSGERTVDLEYPKTADVEKAYEAAAKAYKQDVNDRLNKKEIDGRARPKLMGMVSDKLPEKESFTVGIVDPKYLVLTRESGVSHHFEKLD